MKKLVFGFIMTLFILITGCQDNMNETLIVEETNLTSVEDDNQSSEISNYFQKLDSINESVVRSNANITRGKSEDIGIVAADAYGAYLGAKWGWKNGKGLLGKASLSVVSAVAMAAVASFMAAVQNILTRTCNDGSIIPYNQSYIEFKYIENKNDVLNSVLTTYEYTCDPQKWMEEHPDMEPPLHNMIITSELGDLSYLVREEDSDEENAEDLENGTYLIDAHAIGIMHNDALSYLINGNMCDVLSPEVLEMYNIEMIDSQAFDNAMSDLETQIYVDDSWWLRPAHPLETPSEIVTLTEEQQIKWCDNTIQSYFNGLGRISVVDRNESQTLRNLAEMYISTINGASFLSDTNKIILSSSIMVSAYSYEYWCEYIDSK